MQIMEFIEKGGVFMWPLIVVAFVAVYLITYKFLQLGYLYIKYKFRVNIARIHHLLETHQLEEARAAIQSKGPIETILIKGIEYVSHKNDEATIKDKLAIIYDEVLGHAEKGVSLILVLAEIMPMLGLLGTVSGMINVFKAISIYGAGETSALASGISEALLTTETGLVLAIPTMFLYTVIDRLVEKQAKFYRLSCSVIITASRNV